MPGLVPLEIDVDTVNTTGLRKISDKKAISVPFIKKKKNKPKNASQAEVVAPCGSVMGCEGRFHASRQSTASTRQPLSISASKAVPLSIRCFCIHRVRANERLHCPEIRAVAGAAGCFSLLYAEQRRIQKRKLGRTHPGKGGSYPGASLVLLKQSPNQTFCYKKHFFCFKFIFYFGQPPILFLSAIIRTAPTAPGDTRKDGPCKICTRSK